MPTPHQPTLYEAKGAMYTMQMIEGQKFQWTPASRMPLGNYGKSDPMQYWDVTFHFDLVKQDCIKAGELWDLLSRHQPLIGFNFDFAHF